MAFHIIGHKLENGTRVRFDRTLNDYEFDNLVQNTLINGAFPPNFWAWHFEEWENLENSQKVRDVYKLPYPEEFNMFSSDGYITKNPKISLKKAIKGEREEFYRLVFLEVL